MPAVVNAPFSFSADDPPAAFAACHPAAAALLLGQGLDPSERMRPLSACCREAGRPESAVLAGLALGVPAPPVIPCEDWSQAGMGELIEHLLVCHHRRLRQELPRLALLLDALPAPALPESCGDLRLRFQAFRTAIDHHLHHEETGLFPYCVFLEHGAEGSGPSSATGLIAIRGTSHGHAELAIDLQRLLDQAEALAGEAGEAEGFLSGLRALAEDTRQHAYEEDEILVPAAIFAQDLIHAKRASGKHRVPTQSAD